MTDNSDLTLDANSTAGLSRRELRKLRAVPDAAELATVESNSDVTAVSSLITPVVPKPLQPEIDIELESSVQESASQSVDREQAHNQDRLSGDLFPLTRGLSKGYEPRAVEAFLAVARSTFEDASASAILLSSADVRAVSFPMVRHGYVPAKVDQALARVEDAFAQRERAELIAQQGSKTWVVQAREQAQELLDRLCREKGARFKRTGFWHYGYSVAEVDQVSDRIARYLAFGEVIQVEQLRQLAFSMQRNGYREDQVDAAIDRAIEIVQAVS